MTLLNLKYKYMEAIYETETARLVLGYLDEVNCTKSWQAFLEECPDLNEQRKRYKQGKVSTTNWNGKSLTDILAEYCVFRSKDTSNDSNQSQTSTNSFHVRGVFQTPGKVNENNYTRYTIDQKIRTQSVISSNCNRGQSPAGRRNLFYSPTSRPTSRTPRRRLECQINQLNFGPEADSNNKSSTGYLSSPNLSKKPQEVTKASGLGTECDSDYFSHSTPNKSLHSSAHDLNSSTSEFNDVLALDKQNSSSDEVYCSVKQSSVLNKSVVHLSSEILPSTSDVLEDFSTPPHGVDPPPYNRAPCTNSPRIVLSHDRSLVRSITTPMKDKENWREEEWSPRRKGSIPRRRLVSESPLSKQPPDTTLLQWDSMMESLCDVPLVQFLTENINKIKQNEREEPEFNILEGVVDDVVKGATELIEPEFFEILSTTLSTKDCVLSTVCSELNNPETNRAGHVEKKNESFSVNKTAKSKECDNNSASTVSEISESVINADVTDFNVNVTNSLFEKNGTSMNAIDVNSALENNASDQQSSSIVQKTVNSCSSNLQVENPAPDNSSRNPNEACDTAVIVPIEITHDLITKSSVDQSLQSVTTEDIYRNHTTNSLIAESQVKDKSEKADYELNCKDTENTKMSVESSTKINVLSSKNDSLELNQSMSVNICQTPVGNLANCVQLSTSLPSTPIITSELLNQPNAIVEVPLSTLPTFFVPSYNADGTLQNNMYRIIINTPMSFAPPVGGMCLPLPTFATDISNPLPINTTPTIPVLSETSVVNTNTALSGNLNSLAVTSDRSDQKSAKRKNTEEGNTQKKKANKNNSKSANKNNSKSANKNNSKSTNKGNSKSTNENSSKSANTKTRKSRKFPKRKAFCLFPESPSVKNFETPNKLSDENIPVLSIPESPANSEQSSAFKYFSQITGQYEKGDKSPVLKSLLSNASILLNKSPRLNSAHVRNLDFNLDSNNINEVKASDRSNEMKDIEESFVQKRRSSRISQKSKEKMGDSKKNDSNMRVKSRNTTEIVSSSDSIEDQNTIQNITNTLQNMEVEIEVVEMSEKDAAAIVNDSESMELIELPKFFQQENKSTSVSPVSTSMVKSASKLNLDVKSPGEKAKSYKNLVSEVNKSPALATSEEDLSVKPFEEKIEHLMNVSEFCNSHIVLEQDPSTKSIRSIMESSKNISKVDNSHIVADPNTEISIEGEICKNSFSDIGNSCILKKKSFIKSTKEMNTSVTLEDISKITSTPCEEKCKNNSGNLSASDPFTKNNEQLHSQDLSILSFEADSLDNKSTHKETYNSDKPTKAQSCSRSPRKSLNDEKCNSTVTSNANDGCNVETSTPIVIPHPKKRIRPIPVDSSSNESFGPFMQFLPSQNVSKTAATPCLENSVKTKSSKKCDINVQKIISETEELPNRTAKCSLSKNQFKFSGDTNEEYSYNSNPLSPLSSSLSHSKQFVVPEFKSPISKSLIKPVKPIPSVLQSPSKSQSLFSLSGKPKAMADFYKNAFPDKVGELPVSPLSFSSSSFSCTGDAFSARRKLLEVETNSPGKNKQLNFLNVENNSDLNGDMLQSNKCSVEGENTEESLSYNEKKKVVEEYHKPLSKLSYKLPEKSKEINLRNLISNEAKIKENEDPAWNLVVRKRKRSDSCFSDCSTITDTADCEIVTPMKGDDWLNSDLFRKDVTPVVEKRRKFRRSSSSSEVISDTSPEKNELFKNKLDFSNISAGELPENIVLHSSLQISAAGTTPVDSIKTSADSISVQKTNTNYGKTEKSNIDNVTEVITKLHDKKYCLKNAAKKNSHLSMVPKLPLKQNFSKSKNYSHSDNKSVHPDEEKRKRTIATGKKVRRSRPTTKIASFKSPSKKNSESKSNVNMSSYEHLKNRSTSKTLRKVVNREKNRAEISDEFNVHFKVNGNQIITYSKSLNNNLNEKITKERKKIALKSSSEPSEKQTALFKHPLTKQCVENIDQSTRDIVESDIGRSYDAGSELSIAIASCERELLNSQVDHSSLRFNTDDKSMLNIQEKRKDDACENKEEATSNLRISPNSINPLSKFDLIMKKVHAIGLDNALDKLKKNN